MALADEYRAYVKQHKQRLKRLPYFAESEERRQAFTVLSSQLEKYTLEDVLRWEPGPCSDPIYRVLALDHMVSRERNDEAHEWDEREVVENTVVRGNLHVRGNLVNAVGLTVLGDLIVDGAYVTRGDYPCCQVGGTFSARDYYGFEAETIALGGIRVKDTFFVSYNHTVTIGPFVEAAVFCAHDAEVSAEVRAERKFGPGPIPLEELFGLAGTDEEDRVAEWMLRKSSPAGPSPSR